jgi:hypothetical protein
MSVKFFDEVVATTKKAIANSHMHVSLGSLPHLPHEQVHLYGADAGDDYARTAIDALKDGIKDYAECKQTRLDIRAPAGGKAAQAAMQKAFEELLVGFKVTVNGGHLSVDWKSHVG